MHTFLKLTTLALTAAALTGCDSIGDAEPVMENGQMAPDPSGPPFIETMDVSVSDAAVTACRTTLDAETDGDVVVVGSEFSEAATAVYMRVGANGAPWRCLVSGDGSNPSLMFVGNEGTL
ncbi:hypothetical protein [Aestuariicoccus sp. MJ-SS9]|uniref:hypothetical protein n=1 Tax=Aestuariicoccus sp. MJ-SS9 TaxID=3079855 RepID=UPI0029124D7D|nr:hypothetical protein [Aestuariicoccus sp. MJ-SS9]MDU8911659.1 hypothetical protein [Aestuariicoccus sp. MJ-SS9]